MKSSRPFIWTTPSLISSSRFLAASALLADALASCNIKMSFYWSFIKWQSTSNSWTTKSQYMNFPILHKTEYTWTCENSKLIIHIFACSIKGISHIIQSKYRRSISETLCISETLFHKGHLRNIVLRGLHTTEYKISSGKMHSLVFVIKFYSWVSLSHLYKVIIKPRENQNSKNKHHHSQSDINEHNCPAVHSQFGSLIKHCILANLSLA